MAQHTHIPHKEEHQSFRNIDVGNIKMVNNRVLCKRISRNLDEPIKGIYYPKSYHENQQLVQNVDRIYQVVIAPEKFRYDRWTSEIEILPGDVVWTKALDALNAPEIHDMNGNEYRMLKYDQLVVAKRGDQVIPLNGNVLMVNLYTKVVTGIGGNLEVIREPAIIYALGEVVYAGTSNSWYSSGESDDGVDIKPGDVVIIDIPNKNDSTRSRKYLEEEMFARFDAKKRYFYEKRVDIMAILEK